MAKATKTATAETTEKNPFSFDRETVKEIFAKRPKTLKAADASINGLAGNMSAGKAERTLCAFAYFYGQAHKHDTEKPFDAAIWDERFKIYQRDHYGDALPSKNTLDNLKSATGAFFAAAYAPWNADAIVRENLAICNVQLTWRGGRVRELLYANATKKEFHAKAPKAEAIEEALTGGEKHRAGSSAEKMIAAFMRDGTLLRGDPMVNAYLKANPHVAAWLDPVLAEVVKFRKLDTKAMNNKLAKDAMAKADAVIAAQQTGRGRRAPRNVTTH